MENASKAIIIAGGILIGMITISIFYFVLGHTGYMVETTQTDQYQKQLIAFNTGFEAYNKKRMYGIDIVSVLNKAIDNNRNYNIEIYNSNNTNKDYYVDIEFEFYEIDANNKKTNNKITYILSRDYNTIKAEILDKAQQEDDRFRTFKFSAFTCYKVNYVTNSKTNDATGRVSKMIFKEIKN